MDTFSKKKNTKKISESENNQISCEKKSLTKNKRDHGISVHSINFESIKSKHGQYFCSVCVFGTQNLKDFKRHLMTRKHLKKNPKKTPKFVTNKVASFICDCGKWYKYSSGLSKHKQKCKKMKNCKKLQKIAKKYCKNDEKGIKNTSSKRENGQKIQNTNFHKNVGVKVTTGFQHSDIANDIALQNDDIGELNLSDIMKQTLKQTLNQTETIQKLLEQNSVLIEKLSNKPTNVTYQNCGNKKMTINVFLNEKCKDAMNLSDFVNNMNISLEDLMYTKNYGYNKGISNIFVKHLKDLEPSERPIHCSDKKRMQFYVRDENKWLKDEKNEKIEKTIQELTIKQIKHLKEWETLNPNYLQDDKLLTQWQQLIHEIMGPSDDLTREKDKEYIMKTLGNTVELKNNLIIPT